MTVNYKPLPEELRRNGYDIRLYRRNENYAIYEKWFGTKLIAYEVFKIKKVPERQVMDKVLPAREVFPRDEDFGYTAKTCKTLDRAMERYTQLLILGYFPDYR